MQYLRISVTDKCNLRCVYCMPLEGLPWLKREEILSYEEIAHVVRTMAGMGLERVRITGGEPLVRRDLPDLVHMIAAVPEIEDLSLSTNAVLLAENAEALKQAGVQRLNISLDSLQADRVDAISRRPGSYSKIMEGLDAAEQVGFTPLKINVVLIRGQNDDEIEDFARITRERPWHVRFIELMPMGETGYFSFERLVPLDEMMQLAQPLEPIPVEDWPKGSGPAKYFRRPNGIGSVGFISPLSSNFCSDCNRMRLSAKGILIPCLANNQGTDLLSMLRTGADENEIKNSIKLTVSCKPEKHLMMETATNGKSYPQFMCQMGG